MAAPLPPFLMTEAERARFLGLIHTSRHGHVPYAAWVMDLLRKVLFALRVDFFAALAPLSRRGDGMLSLAGPPEACCWPPAAADTADGGFAPGEVRFDGLTGSWEDGNGAQHAVAWGEAVAGRIWRRPDESCPPLEAVERLYALAGLAILAQRYAARGYRTDGPEGLPFVLDAPPLAPELPGVTPCAEGARPQPDMSSSPGAHVRLVAASSAVAPATSTADGIRGIAQTMHDLARAADDPAQAEAMRAAGLRPDLLAHGERHAARLLADAESLARVLDAHRPDIAPAA